MVDFQHVKRLQEAWAARGSPPCDHPNTDREYYLGSSTGDRACLVCGESAPGLGREPLHELAQQARDSWRAAEEALPVPEPDVAPDPSAFEQWTRLARKAHSAARRFDIRVQRQLGTAITGSVKIDVVQGSLIIWNQAGDVVASYGPGKWTITPTGRSMLP